MKSSIEFIDGHIVAKHNRVKPIEFLYMGDISGKALLSDPFDKYLVCAILDFIDDEKPGGEADQDQIFIFIEIQVHDLGLKFVGLFNFPRNFIKNSKLVVEVAPNYEVVFSQALDMAFFLLQYIVDL